ncbi:MAG: exopolysaccharide biosynthesis polyprenyl glycosylphosphotransferase [Actinomycetes bacterium]
MSLTGEGTFAVGAHRRRRGITSRRYTASLVLVDYFSAWTGFILGLALLNLVTRNAFNRWSYIDYNLRHAFWYPIGVVIGMALTSGYRVSRRSPTQNAFTDFKELAMATSFGGFLAMSISYVAHHFTQWEIQVPTQIIVGVVATTFVIATMRALLRAIVLSQRPVRMAVIDDGATYQRIATHLHLQRGITLYGRIAMDPSDTEGTIGNIAEIEQLAEDFHLDRVFFGSINAITPEIAFWYRRTTELVDTALVPRMFELLSWRSRLTDMSGLPLLEMAPRHVSRFDRAFKRCFDVSVATVLLILTLPISLVIALLIKLTTRGPVFFSQERLGHNRKPFTILKFRTMNVAPAKSPEAISAPNENAPLYVIRGKLQETNRRTWIGSFIRKVGLDEIPQFLNVIMGSMSIVGPRPFIVSESDIQDPHYARRFDVRPGITGLWQVSGRNNLTSEELRQLDYLYVSAWSMWWDMKICFDTPRAMLRGLGAY